MSDISCAVCSEPWDTHHLRHDAPPWVLPLFRAGAGCEACEGAAPDADDWTSAQERNPYTLRGQRINQHLQQRVLNVPFDDDVDPVGQVLDSPRPKWERPEDTVEWECECCGVKYMRDQDWREDSEFAHYFEFTKDDPLRYRSERHHPDDEPEEYEGRTYCSNCLGYCDHCGERLLLSDAAFMPDDHYCREPLHLDDCYLKRAEEQHNDWVVECIDDWVYKADCEAVSPIGLDYFAVREAFDWHWGESDPNKDYVIEYMLDSGMIRKEEEDD